MRRWGCRDVVPGVDESRRFVPDSGTNICERLVCLGTLYSPGIYGEL